MGEKQGSLLVEAGKPAWFASSKNPHWNTPDAYLDLLRRFRGENIGLDPCSNATSAVSAEVEWALERGENGLSKSWRGMGLVFANPPYGRGEIEPWAKHAFDEFAGGAGGDECVLLLPANTDVQWYHRYARFADALCFHEGRIELRNPDPASEKNNGSSVGNLTCYFGERGREFLHFFRDEGDAFLTRAGHYRMGIVY